MVKNKILFLSLILSTSLIGCSNLQQNNFDSRIVGEQSEFFVDRQPSFANFGEASRTPANKDQKSTPENAETNADYHFSLAETYSFEGLSQKAIDEFKTTLLYDPNSETVHLRLAVEYTKVGLTSEAITNAEWVTKKNPKNIEAQLLVGGLYSNSKMYEKALDAYDQVIKNSPKDAAEAHLYIGAIYAEKNDLKKAEKNFTTVTKLNDDKFKNLAYYYLGRLHVFANKKTLAVSDFKKCLSIKPDFEDAVLALGLLYEDMHKPDKAIKLYSGYQDQYGPDATIAKPLAQLCLESEKYDQAYKQYEVILATEPDNLNVKTRLALLDIQRKDYSTATRRLKEILNSAPDSDKIRFYLAAIYEEQNQLNDAVEQFVKIPVDSQFYGEATTHAAYIYRQLNKTGNAISLTETALKNKKDDPQLYALYASLMDEQKKYVDAENMLLQGAKIFPENEQILFFLGSIQDKMGKTKDMVTTMQRVLKINPKNVQALNYLAYTYAEGGTSLAEAEKMARHALKMKSKDAYIRDTLGWVLFKEGKYKEAVKALEFAHKLNPNESIIAEHLGDAYYQYQLFSKAKDMYKHAAQVEKNEDTLRKLEAKIDQIQKMLSNSYKRSPASDE